MTNDLIRRQYETLARIKNFGAAYGGQFTPGSRGAKLFADVGALAGTMQDAGADKLSGSGEYRAGTASKQFWAAELREDLAAIRETAEAIAVAEDTPDFDDQFRAPRGSGYGVLLTAARAFLQDATPHRALFIEFEMPADFLEDLAADIEEFEKARDEQDAGLGGQVGGTANLAELAARGMKLRKQLQAIVKNKFKGNASVLAEWQTAQHLERPSRQKPRAASPA